MEIPKIDQYEGLYKTSGEYVAALRIWLDQVHHMQCIRDRFPYFLAASLQKPGPTGLSTPSRRAPLPFSVTPGQPVADTAREFVVPSLWKRFFAEMIDFMLLFTIKLAVTYVAVDFFDMFDVDHYSLESLREDMLSDYRLTMNMTYDILLLETIHRVGNCVFEALCLHRGGRGVGGATPGKKAMGLRVVRCAWLAPTPDNRVLVFPATDLGLGRSLVRAVAKNIAITLLLPLCVTMFMYQHNRTLYDVLAGSVVVEDCPPDRRNIINNNNNNNNNNNINNNR